MKCKYTNKQRGNLWDLNIHSIPKQYYKQTPFEANKVQVYIAGTRCMKDNKVNIWKVYNTL